MFSAIATLLPCLPSRRATGTRGTIASGDERKPYALFIKNVDERRLDASVVVVHTYR
jgi:hypothetical protein